MFIDGGPVILAAVIFWLFFAFVAAKMAETRGHSVVAWFLVALLFSPLLAILVLLVMPANREGMVSQAGMRKCPQCAELIQAEARICRYCHSQIRVELKQAAS